MIFSCDDKTILSQTSAESEKCDMTLSKYDAIYMVVLMTNIFWLKNATIETSSIAKN